MSRDWQKDMEVCGQASEGPDMCVEDTEVFSEYVDDLEDGILIAKFSRTEDALFFCEAREALPYWLQQYAEVRDDAVLLREQLAKINCDYYADKQRFVVQRRELEESKASEKKLREAIEKSLNIYWEVTIDDDESLLKMSEILGDVLSSLYPKEETKTNE